MVYPRARASTSRVSSGPGLSSPGFSLSQAAPAPAPAPEQPVSEPCWADPSPGKPPQRSPVCPVLSEGLVSGDSLEQRPSWNWTHLNVTLIAHGYRALCESFYLDFFTPFLPTPSPLPAPPQGGWDHEEPHFTEEEIVKLGLLTSSLCPVISELSVMNTSQDSFLLFTHPSAHSRCSPRCSEDSIPASLLNRAARGTHLHLMPLLKMSSLRPCDHNHGCHFWSTYCVPGCGSSVSNVKTMVPVLHKGKQRLRETDAAKSHTQVQLAPRILAKDIVSAPHQPDLPSS